MTFSLTIVGPPASGKSSLTKELRKRVPILTSFSVRSYFGAALRAGTELGLEARPFMESNNWIPEALIARAVEEALDAAYVSLPVIFEGMPGNREQARLLDEVMRRRGLPEPVVLSMHIDLAICEQRSRFRRVCMNCDDGSWPADHTPGRPGLCARCGGNITRRPADEPSYFRSRLETFKAESSDLLAYYPASRVLVLNATDPTARLADLVLGAFLDPSGSFL